MADITNLSEFLSDVANAIRTKKETTEQIPAENFDQEILSIDTIKGQEKTIIPSTTEQIITPDGDYNAITKATVKAVDNTIDSNISPENIKKDINILGVTGTLEEGEQINNQDKEITTNGIYTADEGYTGLGTVTVNVPQEGGSGDVKQFATVEEMQADATAKEGDLAVVYRSEIQNATVDSKFQVATFPETVVLDTALTDYVEVRYRAVDSSKMFDCWGQLDSSMLSMDCYSESGEIRIEYESSDGITYTRTDTTGNPVDFGTEIYYERTEMWNDAIGKFIQVGGMYFEGLYEYKSHSSDELIEGLISVVSPSSYQTSTVEIRDIQRVVELVENKLDTDVGLGNRPSREYLIIKINNIYRVYFGIYIDSTYGNIESPIGLLFADNKSYATFGPFHTGTDILITDNLANTNGTTYKPYCYDVDITNETVTDTQLSTSSFTQITVGSNIKMKGPELTNLGIIVQYNVSNSGSIAYNVSYITSSGSSGTIQNLPTEVWDYLLADTQITLSSSNQLLPNVVGYGKNGLITGDDSIYKNLMPSNIYSMLGINSTDYYVSDSYVTDNCDINSANVISIIPDDNGKLDVIYDILDSSMISFNRDDLLNAGATSTEASKLLADNSVNYIETDNYICLVCGYTPACSKITIAKISKISGNVINVQTIDLSTESPKASQGNYTIHCWHSGDILRLAIGASGYIASSNPAKYSIRIIGIEYDLSTNTYSKFNFTQTPSTGHTNGTNMSGVATGYPLVIDDTWFIPFQTYNGSTIELRSVKIDFANKQITHINTITGGSYTSRNMSPCIPDNDLGKAYIAWTMASNTTNMYKLTSSGISKLIDNISQPGRFGVDVTNHKVYAGVGNKGNIIDTTNDTHIPYSDIEIPAYGTSSICENNIIRTNKYQYIYVFDTEHNKKEQLRILQDGINVYETVCGTYMNNYQIIHQYENGYWRYTFVPYKILNVLHKLGAYTNACSVMTTNKNTNNVNIVEECIPKYMQPIPITQEDYNIALQTANQIKGGNQL